MPTASLSHIMTHALSHTMTHALSHTMTHALSMCHQSKPKPKPRLGDWAQYHHQHQSKRAQKVGGEEKGGGDESACHGVQVHPNAAMTVCQETKKYRDWISILGRQLRVLGAQSTHTQTQSPSLTDTVCLKGRARRDVDINWLIFAHHYKQT